MPTLQIPFPVDQIAAFCQKWKITELAVFGSVLRNDFRPDSDVDILVSFAADAHWSLYDWVDMQEELKGMIGREVDLVEKKGLHNPFRRHAILTTKQVIYAA
jgi:predicted nucleotidyltransferase